MKTLTSAIALGLVLASGAASASSYYELSAKEANFAAGTSFSSTVDLSGNNAAQAFDQADLGAVVQNGTFNYDAELYRGN